MPRWASRITLEVTGVRAECVQDITIDDVVAEGVELADDGQVRTRSEFADLWDFHNAKRGYPWSTNPRVWVYEFRTLIES